jgi:VWFA-related protein
MVWKLLGLCIAFVLSLNAQIQGPVTFRTDVALVHVDVEVSAENGRIVTALAKEDFRVFDEGVEQPIVNFAAAESPLDLILLFDVSGSMQLVVKGVASAAREGLQQLRPGDRVSVMVFNTRSRVILPFTEDLDSVENTIKNDVLGLRFGGGTLIQQSVDDAAQLFLHQSRTERRRAVLIVTDNLGVRTRREQSVVRDFWEADALLSGLIVSHHSVFGAVGKFSTLTPQGRLMYAGMTGIARKTGGDTITAGDSGPAFRDMMQRIRSRYSLYYAMPLGTPGTTRTIRVELTADAQNRYPKSLVRARHGYIVPSRW